jgi:NAD(P)-dependent dehydrogenase (short-subunit alcohol dehydrogenase family)
MEKTNNKSLSVHGKNIIVTGALGYLGKYFCNGLAESGANIIMLDLDEENCINFANELTEKFSIKSLGYYCDITSKDSIKQALGTIKKDFSCIDVLINNASYCSSNPDLLHETFENYSFDEWKKMMDVNINGTFLCCQAIGSLMSKQKTQGSIINIASIYGTLGTDHRIYSGSIKMTNNPASYSTSKGAIISLTRYLATYWGHIGIRVNSISPGGVENFQENDFIKKYSKLVPMERMAKPDEMVGAVIYLSSDASSYVTGQNFAIDGGLSAW